jgi:hypothetical protein
VPLGQVKRELWVLSGNECAWDGCPNRLFDEDGAWIGEIAHIVGAEDGSARHDRDWTPEQLRDISNLMLLCPLHHEKIDNRASRDNYSVEFLCKMKEKHEARYRRAFQGFEQEFLNVTGGNVVTPCGSLGQFWLGDDDQERAWAVETANQIADYLATLTLGARQILAFLVGLDRPIDIYELARHNSEAEPVRTGRLMRELENRKLAYVDDEVPHLVVLPTRAADSVFNGWNEFWDMLRDHMAERTDATVADVIVDLDFSLLD